MIVSSSHFDAVSKERFGVFFFFWVGIKKESFFCGVPQWSKERFGVFFFF